MSQQRYIGRFAPSPSGDLHFGSLITALGSWLQARSHSGLWRVRIEDIDPPREIPGAASTILKQLEHYGLGWDGDILWQSDRHSAYQEALDWLHTQGLSYYCDCSRRRIQEKGGIYDGYCRHRHVPPGDAAIRLRQTQPILDFQDGLRGNISVAEDFAKEDFIIHRRDGLFAYNLAVVVDDHFQGMTEIVRGADLIDPTVRQIALWRTFGWQPPHYIHLPLALNPYGHKLSKQNHAPALPVGDPRPVLSEALCFLNQPLTSDWRDMTVEALLNEAVIHWSLSDIPLNPGFSNGSL